MAVSIADLFVSVGADVSGALTGLNQVGSATDKLSSQFRAAAPAAVVLAGAGAAVGAGLASAVSVATDFEHSMSGIKAVMAPDEVQQFGGAIDELALKLGRDTVFSSSQAAAALEELIKAGVPAKSVLEGAGQAALDLAAATGVSTTEAATVAAQAMNTFGVQAGGLTGVVDRLAAVANASSSDISQLRFGLAAAGGTAAGAGLSFDDTVVALGAMSGMFATGADEGTSFKAFLNGLIPDSKEQKTLFRQLGLAVGESGNAFFDATGKIVNMEQIAGTLHDSLASLNDMQRQQALTTLFGTDGQRAANALFALGADKIQAFATETAAAGVAQRSAQTRLDNLQGALTNLGGSFERVQIQVGRLFLPTLRDIADITRNVVDAFGNMNPETQRLVVFIGAGAAAFAGFLGTMVLLGVAIPPLLVSFAALNAVMIANPIGLIVTALGALVAVGVVLFNTNEDFRNAVLGVWDAIQNRLWPAVVGLAAALGEKLGPLFDVVGQAFQQFVANVGPLVAEFFQTTLPQALAAMGTQLASLGPLFNSLTGFFGAVFNLIGTLASTGGTALQGLFENVLAPGFEKLSAVLGPLHEALQPVFDLLQPMIDNFGTLGEKLQPVTDFFTNLSTAINNAATAISTFQLPPWLTPGTGSAFGAPAGGAQVVPTAFTPGGGGGGAPTLIFNAPLVSGATVTGEADEDRLAEKIFNQLLAATRRASPAVDNSGIPSLKPTFA